MNQTCSLSRPAAGPRMGIAWATTRAKSEAQSASSAAQPYDAPLICGARAPILRTRFRSGNAVVPFGTVLSPMRLLMGWERTHEMGAPNGGTERRPHADADKNPGSAWLRRRAGGGDAHAEYGARVLLRGSRRRVRHRCPA